VDEKLVADDRRIGRGKQARSAKVLNRNTSTIDKLIWRSIIGLIKKEPFIYVRKVRIRIK